MVYDQAQSPRLGQRVPVESTYVQIFDVDPDTPTADLVEAAWPGMLIFRKDTGQLNIYNSDAAAWQDVAGGVSGHLTFVGPTAPIAQAIGDTWFDDDDKYKQYVWNGIEWVLSTGGGNKTTPSSGPPSSPAIGDCWLSTLDWQAYIWDGTQWQSMKVPKADLNSKYALGMVKAVEKAIPAGSEPLIVIFYQSAQPTGATNNDLWVRTSDSSLLIYFGTTWTPINDLSISIPITIAGEPRATADHQISLYYQATAPTGLDAADIGDIWTDAVGLKWMWSGEDWLPIQSGADDIAPDVVGTTHLTPNAVTGPKIDIKAVGTTNIADFAVAVTKMSTATHQIY
jgi:hypothetical protein